MSTKIYNAYRYKKSVPELIAYLQDYRKKWLDWRIGRLYANLCSLNKDHAVFSDGKIDLSKLLEIIKEQTNKPFVDMFDIFALSGSIVVYFHKKSVYIQTFIFDRDLYSKAPPFVTKDMVDFHYQDQADPSYVFNKKYSDKKKEKLEKDWQNRKLVWDDIFKNESTPATAGLTYELTDMFDAYKVVDRIREIIDRNKDLQRVGSN